MSMQILSNYIQACEELAVFSWCVNKPLSLTDHNLPDLPFTVGAPELAGTLVEWNWPWPCPASTTSTRLHRD